MRYLRLIMTGVYTLTYLLGLGISLGWWHTRGFRWLHHALFAAIWGSTLATALYGWWCGVRAWGAPLLVLLWMLPLPRVRAGTPMHAGLATGGLLTLGGVLRWSHTPAEHTSKLTEEREGDTRT